MCLLKLILFFLLVTGTENATASDAVGRLGPHIPFLRLEKSENPQNVLIAYTRVDKDCRFAKYNGEGPVFDFYWLMDKSRYKRVHHLIRNGIEKRIEVSGDEPDRFTVRVKNLTEIEHDLSSPELHVSVRRKGGECQVEPVLKLGPSDGHRLLLVRSLHSESKPTFLPPFRKLKALTITGEVLGTGERVSRTFRSKG